MKIFVFKLQNVQLNKNKETINSRIHATESQVLIHSLRAALAAGVQRPAGVQGLAQEVTVYYGSTVTQYQPTH